MSLYRLQNTGVRLLLAAGIALPAAASLAQDAPIPSVTVTNVRTTDYTLTARLPGRIKASTVAEVRPQVSGIIRERLFEEGASVEKGQLLYKIDDENYISAVASAKAALAEAQANYDLAVIDARRAADLFAGKVGTASSHDNAAAQQSKADAALQRARAELSIAEIDLDRTTVRAPISGAIGFSDATQGALVAAQQTNALTTIRTLDPIYVDVTQSATAGITQALTQSLSKALATMLQLSELGATLSETVSKTLAGILPTRVAEALTSSAVTAAARVA